MPATARLIMGNLFARVIRQKIDTELKELRDMGCLPFTRANRSVHGLGKSYNENSGYANTGKKFSFAFIK